MRALSLVRASKTSLKLFLFFINLLFVCTANAQIKVGLVLDKGGKDDRSFSASAYKGLMEATKALGIQGKHVEATDDNSFEPMLRSLARRDFDLVVAVGIAQADALKKVAKEFPAKKFAIVDVDANLPNVRSLLFEEHEGSFLVGALAAMQVSKENSSSPKIGFIGGMDVPLIRRFELGYKAGAEYVLPKIKLVSNFVGVTPDAWNNPPKAKEIALSQYSSGVSVIFAPAGASSLGLFDAAEQTKKFAIGVDSNQNGIKPGRVLSSMLKRVDTAVFETIKDLKEGKFTTGVKRYGLANKGVDYAMDEHNKSLVSQEWSTKLEKIRADILSGKIKVPDYYKR